MTAGTDTNTDAEFESIDWDEIDGTGPRLGRRTIAFVSSLGALGALFCYDWIVRAENSPTIEIGSGVKWDLTPLDWLFVLSLVVFAFAVVVPAVRNRDRTMQYWRRFRRNRLAVACAAYLAVFFVLGTASLLVLDRPSTNIQYAKQPALFATVEAGTVALAGAGDHDEVGARLLGRNRC